MKRVSFAIRPQFPRALILFAVLFAVTFCGFSIAWKLQIPLSHDVTSRLERKTVEITSDVSVGTYSNTSFGSYDGMKIQIIWPEGIIAPEYGREVKLTGFLKNRGFSDYERYLFTKGVGATLTVSDFYAQRWPNTLRGVIGHFRYYLVSCIKSCGGSTLGAGLLRAVLLGDRRDVGETDEIFRVTGLSHMLSVSGSHLSIIMLCFGFVLLRFGIGKKSTFVFSALAGFLFVIITTSAEATLRSYLMLLFGGCVFFFRRRTDPLTTLGICGIVLLIGNPIVVLSVGFQLSVAAVFGILLFGRLMSVWLDACVNFFPRFVRETFGISMVAQISTLPISIPVFGMISLVGPFSNVFAGGLLTVTLALGLGGIVAGGVARPLSQPIFFLATRCCDAIIFVAQEFALLSWGSFEIGAWGVPLSVSLLLGLIAVYLLWPLPKNRVRYGAAPGRKALLLVSCSVCMLFILFPHTLSYVSGGFIKSSDDGVYVLDVGQGDAILVKNSHETALIDAGPDSIALKKALDEIGVIKIDTLIFTHTHQDHIGGAFGLDKRYGIKTIVVANGVKYNSDISEISRSLDAPVTEISAGDSLRVGKLELTCVGPKNKVSDPDDNGSCLILLADEPAGASYDYESVLITGDAEADSVKEAFSQSSLIDREVDVLKVGHHGSAVSVDAELLSVMKPKRAVISVGENSYGHPTQKVLTLLRSFHIPYLRTDLSGTIFLGSVGQ
ncbi:MAG: DNA internalization-related competence protein ComEC/Rec2 [Coriobacteriia bacterium]|nr:DNA internalization-related competence protein ComEC/Rec2 [Coriobacteriia bacterium]